MRALTWRILVATCWHGLVMSALADESKGSLAKIDFNLEIRPILSKYCFRCHGLDENSRKAGLRLDHFEGATGTAESGLRAIVPMRPDESELLRRVTTSEPSEQMPPTETGQALSEAQVGALRRWIEAGAPFARHWAFEKPLAALPSSAKHGEWTANSIDRFVSNRLEKEKLTPSTEADPARLLRRVSLDLIGLPPTIEELDAFLAQAKLDREQAYLDAVDRLLSSPHFGERMAIDWLDAARYADTNGYFGDRPRQAWPWRDWVIASFNSNMPFDQFTIEQLAGDLLPDATRNQRIATGFHRNSMANNETGIIDEEYRVEAVVDRVDTTATVWMGLTLACAQCHDHKYDPISQQEYYQFFAYFNDSKEQGLVTSDSPPPSIEVPTAEQEHERYRRQQQLVEQERKYAELTQTLDKDLADWQQTALEHVMPPMTQSIHSFDFDTPVESAKAVGTAIKNETGIRGQAGRFDGTQHVEIPSDFDADQPWTISAWFKPDTSLGCLLSKIESTEQRRGIEILWQKGRLQINLVHQWGVNEIAVITQQKITPALWHHVLIEYDGSRKAGGIQLKIDGQDSALSVRRDQLAGSVTCAEPFRIGRRDAGLGFYGLLDQFVVLPRIVSQGDSTNWHQHERLRGVLERPKENRSSSDLSFLKEYFIETLAKPEIKSAFHAQEDARRSVAEIQRLIPTALVMESRNESRTTHVLMRGQYDQPGVETEAGVPAFFPGVPAGAPRNRLTLARWLVSGEHPLTARVIVNRLWQICFGEGLVRTPNDFGSQGEMPTHQELLDYLAVQFVENGWDIKKMLRLIVTSATYRQSSQGTAEELARDPDNRLLARGPRFRLPAELVRDYPLWVSGLLSRRVGGPSVKPYQPAGLWEEVSYNEDDSYVQDTDDGLWRRSLYTYWKRQSPPPAQLIFDAGTREKCLVRRSRTNTPLQALVMLNDPTWVEASRVLAEKTLIDSTDDTERLRTLFRRIMSRPAEAHEVQLLNGLLGRMRTRYANDPHAAEVVVKIGASKPDPEMNACELAAWTVVAQTILNLDEAVTRR